MGARGPVNNETIYGALAHNERYKLHLRRALAKEKKRKREREIETAAARSPTRVDLALRVYIRIVHTVARERVRVFSDARYVRDRHIIYLFSNAAPRRDKFACFNSRRVGEGERRILRGSERRRARVFE